MAVGLDGRQEMWQENKGEQSASQQGERGKQTEIAEQVAFGEEQATESAYRGDAAQEHRRRLIQKQLFGVADEEVVDEHMQTVADADTQHDGAYAQGHQRHAALDPINAGKGEHRAIEYGQQ